MTIPASSAVTRSSQRCRFRRAWRLTLHTAREEESFLSLTEGDRADQVSGLPVMIESGSASASSPQGTRR